MTLYSKGCSAFTYETEEKEVLFGRNFDFNRISEDTKLIYMPKGTTFYTCGCKYENNVDQRTKQISKYNTLGIGTSVLEPTIAYYDGINEEGLAVAQLYFRELAKFNSKYQEDKLNIQPFFLVTYLLAMCKDVKECKKQLLEVVSLYGLAVFGEVAPLHFIASDKKGNSIIIEQEESGLKIYEENLGIMTNSPSYSWHLTNLTNYYNLSNEDKESKTVGNYKSIQMFSGQGLQGMPGDFSSTSRFIRLAFLKEYLLKAKNHEEGVAQVFKAMQNVSFPLGMCKAKGNGKVNEFEKGYLDYDYTIYTVVASLKTLDIYINTYHNLNIYKINLKDLANEKEIKEFDFLNKKIEYQKL